jgi:hypothetical protein
VLDVEEISGTLDMSPLSSEHSLASCVRKEQLLWHLKCAHYIR